MMFWALAACLAASMDAPDWVIVAAHPDDELVFINPDLQDALAQGRGVTTLFLTAGDAGLDAAYWSRREAGMREAYAAMAKVTNRWSQEEWILGGRTVPAWRLHDRPIALLFLRLPDGMLDGAGSPAAPGESLARLWRRQSAGLTPRDGRAPLDRDTLLRVLAALLQRAAQADAQVATLSCEPHAREHQDHLATGLFVAAAAHAVVPERPLHWYSGSAGVAQPSNLEGDVLARKTAVFAHYARYDPAICPSLSPPDCAEHSIYGPMLRRRYVTVAPAAMVQLSESGCWLNASPP